MRQWLKSNFGRINQVAHRYLGMIGRLTSGQQTFIAFADSCLTGKFDENDAIGESLVNHAGGCAVASIGNSR